MGQNSRMIDGSYQLLDDPYLVGLWAPIMNIIMPSAGIFNTILMYYNNHSIIHEDIEFIILGKAVATVTESIVCQGWDKSLNLEFLMFHDIANCMPHCTLFQSYVTQL